MSSTNHPIENLRGAPEEYRGERWTTGDYSGRIGEEAHSSICPLKLPDKVITVDLWWELLRGPQWSHRRLEGRNLPPIRPRLFSIGYYSIKIHRNYHYFKD